MFTKHFKKDINVHCTWSKRGHTASYGFIIPVETGQVLDYGFRSKICTSCNEQKADKDSDE